MGIFAEVLSREQRSNIETILKKAQESFYGGSSTGIFVSPGNAMRSAAVYACVRVLAETVASLPLFVYQRRGESKERAVNHYLYPLLHDAPNPKMTAFEFFETLQGHLALWGNAYAQIEYNGRGQVRELWPLRPDRMMDTKTENGRRFYLYQSSSNEMVWLAEDIIWHVRGLGGDGLNGYSPISLMRKSVGLGMAAEEYGSRFFGNGARPGGLLEHPGKLTDEAHKRMKESWEQAHAGLSQSNRVAILEEGVKYTQIGIPPEDAQFLETRKFQVTEVARAFRIPPHLIGDLERATFSNIEHQAIEFVVHTMRPWLVRWEKSISKNLLLPRERRNYFAEFLVDGLLRGDTQSRYQAYAVGRQNGWLSANDVRAFENMNPINGGDTYLIPLNMIPVNQARGEANMSDQTIQPTGFASPLREAEERSIDGRRRVMGAQRGVMAETLGRVFRREANDISVQVRKMLKPMAAAAVNAERSLTEILPDGKTPAGNGRVRDDKGRFVKRGSWPEVEAWLREFYQGHREWTVEQVRSTFQGLAELIAAEAGEEVGGEIVPEAVANFVEKYAQSFAERQSALSEERVLGILGQELAVEEILEELEAEFEHWRNERGAIMAANEVVQQGNAVSKFAYGLAGVTSLRWVTRGDSCPYCKSLDGRVVEIKQFFLGAGQDFQPEGAQSPLRPSVDVGHPPAHGGCDCIIVSA